VLVGDYADLLHKQDTDMRIFKAGALGLATMALVTGCVTVPKVDQIAEFTRVYEAGLPLMIGGWFTRMNSAGGVGPVVTFVNSQPVVLKYVRFWFEPYDRVGTKLSSDLSSKVEGGVQSTGPFEPKIPRNKNEFDPVWYNRSIHCIEMTRVEVVYMDDQVRSFDRSQTDQMMAGFENSCKK
jgi:hypothetical protein